MGLNHSCACRSPHDTIALDLLSTPRMPQKSCSYPSASGVHTPLPSPLEFFCGTGTKVGGCGFAACLVVTLVAITFNIMHYPVPVVC